MSDVSRDQLLSTLTDWLDEALSEESPPSGLAAEFLDANAAPPAADQHALWSAMTVLSQEVRLQGRSFKQLSETIAPVSAMAEPIESLLKAHTALDSGLREHIVERERQAERRGRAAVFEVLIDMADRLQRGLAGAQVGSPPVSSWWSRMVGRRAPDDDVASRLEEGYRLTLARLQDALDAHQVTRIHCQGGAFDARQMQATAVEEVDGVTPGTVLEIIREGYLWQGEVFRPAQVKVARARATSGGQS